MFKKLQFRNNILNRKNYRLLFIITFLTIVKDFFLLLAVFASGFLFNVIHHDSYESILDHPEGYYAFNDSNNLEIVVSFSYTGFYIIIFFILTFIAFCFRIRLFFTIKTDQNFMFLNLSRKLYRTLLFLLPHTAIPKIFIKSYFINRTFTTTQLIRKWRISNGVSESLQLFWIISITLFLTGLVKLPIEIIKNRELSQYSLSILSLSYIFSFLWALLFFPMIYIASHSAELYNEIRVKEQINWWQAGFCRITTFLHYFFNFFAQTVGVNHFFIFWFILWIPLSQKKITKKQTKKFFSSLATKLENLYIFWCFYCLKN
ncbi:hypothetical protein MBVR141_0301 [Mycoplasmopsis bovirhinis]|uniref:hypothetical protein n=1 Tax=Mycoplasmopsis bovirhinis TaxID=29553 RepID=UPI000BB9E41F|nr:hypothetical protein [Mycoplasmopsis bovirhinis]BBA22223.1 hypothetical protein MBVR141_0301 [Mycoplasmopsis bovirhinis]